MGGRRKRVTEIVEVSSREKYFLITKCPCGHEFGPREKFTLTTAKNDWFRGHDSVKVECKSCRPLN